MKSFKIALLAATAGLVIGGSAHASVISGGTATNGPAGSLTDYNTTLGSLSKFDTTLGTLTSVKFSVSYGFNSTITVTAITGSTGSVRTESAAQFSSSDAAITSVLNSVVNTTAAIIGAQTLNPAAYDIIGTNNIYNFPTGGAQPFSSTGSGNNVYNSSAAGTLSAFSALGGGAFDAIGRTLTGTIVQQTGGNASAVQVTTAVQSITVDYTYTDAPPPPPVGVPEPATMALLGAGLVGLGLIRRKQA